MHREFWCFLGGMAFVLLPLFVYLAYQKSGLSVDRPDRVISYREVDGHTLKLHIFEADGDNPDAVVPALLLFHGGAWQYGDPRQFYAQCRYFSRHGLTCISAQYRIESVHGTDPTPAIRPGALVLYNPMLDLAPCRPLGPPASSSFTREQGTASSIDGLGTRGTSRLRMSGYRAF